MKKRQLLIPILVGLIVGQIFAEGDRPFTIINTLRFGYDDNVYRSSDDPVKSAYIQDVIDLSFRAALSDRTDLIFKSRFDYRSDKEMNFYPNIYAVLTHSVSPRLLIQLSDKYRSGSKTSREASERYNYFENTLSFVPSYVLTPQDSLSAPVSYKIKRHEEEVEKLDTDILSAGLTWKRTLSPQRTWVALNLNQMMIDYINRDSSYDSTRITAEISHTFNPEWHGSLEFGVSFDQTDFAIPLLSTNVTSESMNPFFRAGLEYEPSPRTRFTADISQQYSESESTLYAGQTSRELRLGAQHDFTAKIMGKVTARFGETERDQQESETGGGTTNEERFDLDFRLHYKLNRINFLELGMKHSEKTYDTGDRSWDQNMIDVGWRVEL